MPGPFEQLIRHCEGIIQNEEVRKEKQLIGMREAQRKGIHIGHTAIPISKKFLKLERLYSEKVISAKEAAEGLNIAVSTFYKLRKKYRKEIEGMEDIRKMILFLIMNISAFLCYLLGKENRRKRENEHEEE